MRYSAISRSAHNLFFSIRDTSLPVAAEINPEPTKSLEVFKHGSSAGYGGFGSVEIFVDVDALGELSVLNGCDRQNLHHRTCSSLRYLVTRAKLVSGIQLLRARLGASKVESATLHIIRLSAGVLLCAARFSNRRCCDVVVEYELRARFAR